ncbi:Endo-1,4-beta-xylanase A precursor [Sporotomaculum syntrophicum]|uniref:Endo-1,4-beta-xylanase A n=1 Tax=Sporotomaculum syntrophicum TaxID=182264 RepID=A0A9D3AYH6_9FIRM|nr:S-layer homology domain-containing protein [Sporotomaculum syntrophicum]KAF1085451.1 Endo-1,4-beta-xylanase A precursor [Sporotomaculum syntrophicum]
MKKSILSLGLAAGLLMMPVAGFAQTPFTDIQGHWAVREVEQVYHKGIMKGIAKDKYAPNQLVTRAEVAVCLDRIFDLNYDHLKFIKEPSPADYYDDVAAGQWYSEAITRAGIYNIFNLDNRKFDPKRPVTRLEVAVAIDKAFQAKKLSVITTEMWPLYEDTTYLPHDEQLTVAFMFNSGIMKGRSANQFQPNGNITRAELAAVLNRTLTTLNNAQPVEDVTEPMNVSVIQSEELDLYRDGTPEKINLYQKRDPRDMPVAFHLTVDGQKVLEIGGEDGLYTNAGFKAQDVDGDGKQ